MEFDSLYIAGEYPGIGGPCTIAHYCPAGTSSPLPCEAGSYNNLTGQSECFECQAGYYCPGQISTFMDYPCPEVSDSISMLDDFIGKSWMPDEIDGCA